MLSQQTSFNEQTYGYANLFHKARTNRPGAECRTASGRGKIFRGVEGGGQVIAGDGGERKCSLEKRLCIEVHWARRSALPARVPSRRIS